MIKNENGQIVSRLWIDRTYRNFSDFSHYKSLGKMGGETHFDMSFILTTSHKIIDLMVEYIFFQLILPCNLTPILNNSNCSTLQVFSPHLLKTYRRSVWVFNPNYLLFVILFMAINLSLIITCAGKVNKHQSEAKPAGKFIP